MLYESSISSTAVVADFCAPGSRLPLMVGRAKASTMNRMNRVRTMISKIWYKRTCRMRRFSNCFKKRRELNSITLTRRLLKK